METQNTLAQSKDLEVMAAVAQIKKDNGSKKSKASAKKSSTKKSAASKSSKKENVEVKSSEQIQEMQEESKVNKRARKAAGEAVQTETVTVVNKDTGRKQSVSVVNPPNVDTEAEPIEYHTVKGARVLIAQEIVYRGATIKGTEKEPIKLEIAPNKEPKEWRSGDVRVPVKLDWFEWGPFSERGPSSGYINVVVRENEYEIKQLPQAKVVMRLGRKSVKA